MQQSTEMDWTELQGGALCKSAVLWHLQMVATGDSRTSQTCMRDSKQHSEYAFDEGMTL